ncbi:hypothetical protein CK203_062623 [Vitis vinifera]|uniref:Uncharacterized protein n=1 Tax=Vitis vinifera TaxID=29760 RepID=A0A438FZ98_VITVI|nr:hypothetical protein CK203_062623 [Vitis vinifera]
MGKKIEEKEENRERIFCIALTSVLLLVEFVVVVDPTELSPAPAPKSSAEDVALSPYALSLPLSPIVPSPSPYFGSPPCHHYLWNLLCGLRLTCLRRRHHIRLIMGMLADPRRHELLLKSSLPSI